MKPTARSLIVDLLSTLRGGSMPVRALVAAGEHFGMAENAVRVALARLYAIGRVERDERGCYSLGTRSQAMHREVASWRTRHETLRPWSSRTWVAVHAPGAPSSRGARRTRERALAILGFRSLAPGLAVRPDNLEDGVAGTRSRLRSLCPDLRDTPEVVVASLSDLDAPTTQRALSLWDADSMVRAYEQSGRDLAESASRLVSLGRGETMVETFLVGGRVLRQIVLDPLLPDEIVPAARRAALVEAMRRYDEIGRASWSDFLRAYDVPHWPGERTPADLRVTDTHLASDAARA